MPDRRRDDPGDLSLRDARRRYLNRRGADATDSSIHGWRYRLKIFIEWCDEIGIETVGEITRLDLDEYYEKRASEVKSVTLEGQMWTLAEFISYLEDLGAVDDGLSDAIRIPDLDESERSNDVKLRTEAALTLIRHYRNDPQTRGSRQHALLELAWFTGARIGGLRALDVRDVHLGDTFIEFRHRPGSGTPLKNKLGGERPVALPNGVVETLRRYVDNYRNDVHDDAGRQPLLASRDGRPGPNTVRVWSYLATQPCKHRRCPHEKGRETCKWVNYAHSSKCPSSRSPHRIRTGSVTWQLNLGLPTEVVAERVNATVKTIKSHYDKADIEERRRRQRQQMEQHRRPYIQRMEDINETP